MYPRLLLSEQPWSDFRMLPNALAAPRATKPMNATARNLTFHETSLFDTGFRKQTPANGKSFIWSYHLIYTMTAGLLPNPPALTRGFVAVGRGAVLESNSDSGLTEEGMQEAVRHH